MKPHNQKRVQELLSQGRSIDESARIIASENNETNHAQATCYWREQIIDDVWLGKLRV